MAETKLKMPYAEISEDLKKVLSLVGSPVAIRLAKTKEEVPPGIPEQKETVRHCQMVNSARKEGAVFFATSVKHQCNGGIQRGSPR